MDVEILAVLVAVIFAYAVFLLVKKAAVLGISLLVIGTLAFVVVRDQGGFAFL